MGKSWEILEGNVFDVLPTIPAGSIDCAVTSPPYWMLRSYLPKGHALKPLEMGSEPTPAAFVDSMVRVFRLVRDALADHAVCFLNIGDTYSCSAAGNCDNPMATSTVGRGRQGKPDPNATHANEVARDRDKTKSGIDAGNLCLIPQRLAIALQDDGWLVRSVVVWHKPAPMPSSVSGWSWRRCRRKVGSRSEVNDPRGGFRQGNATVERDGASHRVAEWSDCPGCPKCEPHGGYVLRRGSWRPTSSWEPVLMLAKSSRYYCDGEAVKQPSAAATVSRNAYTRVLKEACPVCAGDGRAPAALGGVCLACHGCGSVLADPDEQFAVKHDHETTADGANLRDVWTIAAEPLKAKHYAAYPSELVYRCLAAGTSSRGYCPACGSPWARVMEVAERITEGRRELRDSGRTGEKSGTRSGTVPGSNTRGYPSYEDKTLGWRPTCSCPPHEPRPGRVLDPFCGSGRTGVQALRMGLEFVGCELNPEYVALAKRMLEADSPLFNAQEAP